jgi:hypothetical protein
MTNLYRPELATQGLVGDRVKWEQDFQQFLKQQGRTLTKIPLMGYREIDFYTLYREVICWGGYDKVIKLHVSVFCDFSQFYHTIN